MPDFLAWSNYDLDNAATTDVVRPQAPGRDTLTHDLGTERDEDLNDAPKRNLPSSAAPSGFVQPCAAANGSVASLLQAGRPRLAIAELGSLGRSHDMQPMLATDYGNFGTYLIGVPALLLALLIGIPCGFFRVRALAVLCGIVCILAGALFFRSLPDAKVADRTVTIVFGACSLIAGVALIFIKRKTRA